MPKIERSIFINAPVEKVFSYVHEPKNMLEYWPSMLEVKNVKALPNGGYKYDWVYNMAGIHINGHADWVEYVENERVVNKNESGIPAPLSGHINQKVMAHVWTCMLSTPSQELCWESWLSPSCAN
jgi:uncharacterized membrane protein